MKKRMLTTTENLTEDVAMGRTNYCPVFLEAETDGPIVSKKNPKGFTCSYICKSINDKDAKLEVFIKNKKGQKVAKALVEYDTRDGWIKNNLNIQLENTDYGRANNWIKEIRYVRAFIKSLLHRFGEVNDDTFKDAVRRPRPVAGRVSPEVPRAKNYSVTEWQVKGHYRKFYNKRTGEIKITYVPASIAHVH